MRLVHSVNDYIRSFPKSTRQMLQHMRRIIHATAPAAKETISYQIPTFTLNGNLVHFAGYAHHIGFYPGSAAIFAFKQDISKYTWAKGSVQFPLDKPLPVTLIRKIVKFRVAASLPQDPFHVLASPARRALVRAGITSIKQLSKTTEHHISGLHGIGPNARKLLRTLLRAQGLSFSEENGR